MDTKGEISAWEINTTYPTADVCFSRECLQRDPTVYCVYQTESSTAEMRCKDQTCKVGHMDKFRVVIEFRGEKI